MYVLTWKEIHAILLKKKIRFFLTFQSENFKYTVKLKRRRLLRVPWTAKRSNQSILKEINPEYSLEGLMLKLKP